VAVLPHSSLTEAFNKPRRAPTLPSPEVVEAVSALFRKDGSRYLFTPDQALAVLEMFDCGYFFGIMPVGAGKTTLAHVAPRVLEAERPVYLAPAGAIPALQAKLEALGRQLDGGAAVQLVSYTAVSRSDTLLDELKPDLLILDEGQMFANPRAGLTRRWLRYMDAFPETPIVYLSGTPGEELQDYAHILLWAAKDAAPIPCHHDTLQRLAGAINRAPKERHLPFPGLEPWATDAEKRKAKWGGQHALDVARAIWRRRLLETPGVVSCAAASCSQPLTVGRWRVEPPQAIQAALKALEELWELPDGQMFSDTLSLETYSAQLSVGFYYRLRVQPPTEWKEALRAWSAAVRRAIFQLRRGLDTEGAVKADVLKGELPSDIQEAYFRWAAVEDSFNPKDHREAVWLDDFALKAAEEWIAGGGLVWCAHIELGEALSARTGLPYYRERGRDAAGRHIDDHPKPLPAILSRKGCSTTLDLQWANRNLFLGCTPCDQSLGRSHRQGQTRPVSADVFVSSRWCERALTRAHEQAKVVEQTEGIPSVFGALEIQDNRSK
jgi:hypothetical protein